MRRHKPVSLLRPILCGLTLELSLPLGTRSASRLRDLGAGIHLRLSGLREPERKGSTPMGLNTSTAAPTADSSPPSGLTRAKVVVEMGRFFLNRPAIFPSALARRSQPRRVASFGLVLTMM